MVGLDIARLRASLLLFLGELFLYHDSMRPGGAYLNFISCLTRHGFLSGKERV